MKDTVNEGDVGPNLLVSFLSGISAGNAKSFSDNYNLIKNYYYYYFLSCDFTLDHINAE